ncbi:MAG: tRNA (adenine-N1)-methyltransferase [Ignisphaera sp.]
MTSGLIYDDDNINFGDKVLIYFDHKRRWITRIEKSKTFSCDRGKISLENIVGLSYGAKVKTSTNFDAYILKPLLIDHIEKGLKRVTQVIYPKDQGFIVLLLSLSPGLRVLEIGVGTGSTTVVLANFVRPTGHVYGYEVREEFLNVAKKNIEELGLQEYVTFKHRNACEGIDERDIDAALIDVGDPWNILDNLHISLKPSAPVVFFIPSMNQIEKLYKALIDHGGFIDIRCYEVLVREIKLSRESIRPANLMVGHTGYIMFARKIVKEIGQTV